MKRCKHENTAHTTIEGAARIVRAVVDAVKSEFGPGCYYDSYTRESELQLTIVGLK